MYVNGKNSFIWAYFLTTESKNNLPLRIVEIPLASVWTYAKKELIVTVLQTRADPLAKEIQIILFELPYPFSQNEVTTYIRGGG